MPHKAIKKIFVVGLTGQSGSGKTLVSEYLAGQGIAVVNADLVARSVTADGSDCNKKLRELFPDCVSEQLVLNRRALADIVFNDKVSLQKLNDTIFPYINAAISEEIKQYEEQGRDAVILDAPTLFEAGADKLCDMIVSVVADESIRMKRIQMRDGLTAKQAAARFSSQNTAEFFRQRSDVMINNNGATDELIRAAEMLVETVKEKLDE